MSDDLRRLTINGAPPRLAGLEQLESMLGGAIPDGDYWYDRACGAWGPWGGQTQGFLPPGLDLGAPLPIDASGGATPVIVNGRALHPLDVAALNQILSRVGAQCLPGRWTLDANGNLGVENGPVLVNLYALQVAGGGDNYWSSRFSAGNESGGFGYVSLPGGGSVSYGPG